MINFPGSAHTFTGKEHHKVLIIKYLIILPRWPMAALRLSKAYKDTRPHGVVIIDLWGYKTGYACISVFPFQAMLSGTHLIFFVH